MSFFELFDIVAGARRNTIDNNNNNENNRPSNNNNNDEESEHSQIAENQGGQTILTNDNLQQSVDTDKNGSDLVSNELKMNRTRTVSGAKFQLNMNKLNRNNSNTSNNGGSNTGGSNQNSPRGGNSNNNNNSRSNSVFNLESPKNKVLVDGFLGPPVENSTNDGGENGDNGQNNTNGGGDNVNTPRDGKVPSEFDYYNEYYTKKGELKLFVVPSKWWQWDTMKMALLYLSKLTLIGLLVTFVACAYIAWYIIVGNRFVFVTENDDKPRWGLALSIIAGVINEQFLVTVGYCVLTSQFGFKATKKALPVAILFSITCAVYTICGRVFQITGTADFIPKYLFTLGNIIIISFIVGWKTFKSKLFTIWAALPYVTLGIILIAYDYFLIKWYIKSSTTEFEKSVVRIVIHPVITALLLLMSRFSINQMAAHKPRSVISLMLIPIALNSFYGKLFGNTMESLSAVVISSLILSILEIVWKCSLRARDSFIVRFLCRCSGNASQVMQQNLPLYTEYQSFEMIYDLASTFVSTFMVIAYFITFSDQASLSEAIAKQFKIMAIQLGFAIVTEISVAYVSLAYLKLPIIIPYKNRKKGFIFITLFSFLSVIAFITIRIVNVLHNQWIV